MATYNNKPASVGLSDPKLVRQTETALAQAAIIARGKPTVTSAGELILPNTTLAVGATSVSTTTSANNSSADIVTVYSGQGAIYASSIDQTVSQTIVNQVGVNSIVAGNNVTITSTGTSAGTGIVTINAVLDGNSSPGGSNTQIQFNDANAFGGNAGFTFNKTTGVLAAPFFSGPGNSLSNIQGANVTGAVAFAGTANLVALANVSGAGNIASINLTGSTTNVLYGNGVFAAVAGGYGNSNVATFLASYGSNTMTTTGNVSVGNIIGNGQALTNIAGANVSGFVPNANVANTAFAVAAANVSGLGNIATINLDGNASNVLFGNGTFRAFTAFSSNINGNGFNLGNVGNLGVTGVITATGNVTGGNIITGGRAEVTGTANTVGGGATVGVRSILAIDSAFGSNDANDPASAQAIRGRVTGSNLSKTRNYVAGVTGQYLITGTNASEFINTGLLGVVGDQTTTANAAVVAYLDGDGGLTTAGSAYGVSMKNSTPGSGFDYGLDLQFINLDIVGTTTPFKQADIRFNNGVELVANTANNISINANVTAGNIFATNLGNIASINLTGSTSNVLYGNGAFGIVSVTVFTANVNGNGFNLGNVGNLGVTGAISAIGNANVGNLNVIGTVKTGVFATGNIPAAATAGAGARAFVTDATVVTFGSAYVGGAANAVPVYSNGTGWFIG